MKRSNSVATLSVVTFDVDESDENIVSLVLDYEDDIVTSAIYAYNGDAGLQPNDIVEGEHIIGIYKNPSNSLVPFIVLPFAWQEYDLELVIAINCTVHQDSVRH